MMELTVIGSGSKGNAYVIQDATDALVLEAGVKVPHIKKAFGFITRKVAGCLVTHEHGDHAAYAPDMVVSGIPTYMSRGTADAVFTGRDARLRDRVHILEAGVPTHVGRWEVLPFGTVHDAAEPLGFLIRHPETGVFLFATDTYYLPCTFDGLNNVMIECNYDGGLLKRNMDSGIVPPSVAQRVLTSHLSVDRCIEALRANDLSAVNDIVLIHLSGANGDADAFRGRVRAATGRRVTVAAEGLKMPFEAMPF